MMDYSVLSDDQVFGNNQLEIMSQYGSKCAITDFAILLGGYVSPNYFSSDGDSIKNRTGWWWTKTPSNDGVIVISPNGNKVSCNPMEYRIGVRPMVPYSTIASRVDREARNKFGVFEVKYGEYPQTVVSKDLSKTLEYEYFRFIHGNGSYSPVRRNPFIHLNYTHSKHSGNRYRNRQNGNISDCEMKDEGFFYAVPFVNKESDMFIQDTAFFVYSYMGKKYIRLAANQNFI